MMMRKSFALDETSNGFLVLCTSTLYPDIGTPTQWRTESMVAKDIHEAFRIILSEYNSYPPNKERTANASVTRADT